MARTLTDEEKKAAEERDIANKEFLDFVVSSSNERVKKAKLSSKPGSLPCCLTTEGGVTLEMEKYFRYGPNEEMRSIRANRVLELNPDHAAVKALQNAYENDRESSILFLKQQNEHRNHNHFVGSKYGRCSRSQYSILNQYN